MRATGGSLRASPLPWRVRDCGRPGIRGARAFHAQRHGWDRGGGTLVASPFSRRWPQATCRRGRGRRVVSMWGGPAGGLRALPKRRARFRMAFSFLGVDVSAARSPIPLADSLAAQRKITRVVRSSGWPSRLSVKPSPSMAPSPVMTTGSAKNHARRSLIGVAFESERETLPLNGAVSCDDDRGVGLVARGHGHADASERIAGAALFGE